MLITIIQSIFKSVYVNGQGAGDLPITIPPEVLSLEFFDNTHGTVFYVNGTQEAITAMPAWAVTCVEVYESQIIPPPPPPPPPTPQETNKSVASSALYATDWTTIPDITDPTKSTPTLKNQAEFLVYRNQMRAIAINPPDTPVVFPPTPEAQWE